MRIGHIDGASRTLGEAQGYQPLPVRYGVLKQDDGSEAPVMSTAWTPDEKELEALNKGASIHLHILGTAHPPCRLDVGPVPGDNDE